LNESKPFRERLAFDAGAGEIRDGEVRYLLIRPDTLMGLFAGLPAALRGQALEALARSTTEHGAKSARRYQVLGAAEAEQLLATIEATAPQLGWGLWSLDPGADGALDLEVRNSPFAAGFGASDEPVCAAIAGMLAAVAGLVGGREMAAREVACVAMGAPSCRFEARPK
jgi:predicted hydrocarbon binding protein